LIEGPALFDISDETDKAVVLDETPGEDLRGQAEAAARGCPARAVFIEDI
jgi:ferredoxin